KTSPKYLASTVATCFTRPRRLVPVAVTGRRASWADSPSSFQSSASRSRRSLPCRWSFAYPSIMRHEPARGRPRPQPPARATPGSVGRLARPRTQHTRADQHDDDDAEDDPVPDERHEALGGDELHEPRDHGVTGRERDDRGEDGRAPGDVA